MEITHTAITASADNIIADGDYWGQRTRIYGSLVIHGAIRPSWFVTFNHHGIGVIGVNIDDADYDTTIRQLVKLTRSGMEPPF